MDDSLPIPQVTTKYSIIFVVNPGFAIIDPYLASTTIFFEHYCHMLSTFHDLLSIFSEMAQFCFSSDSQIEIWSIKFFSINHVTPKRRASLCIQLYANASKQFYDQYFLSYVIAAHMTIFFNFLEDFINIFHNRPTRTKYIFDIKISISKSAKPIYCCLSN